MDDYYFPEVGLGLTLWSGVFEGKQDTWLRWCDKYGNVLPTGTQSAQQAQQEAQTAKQRAAQLEAQLRALVIEPQN